MKKEQFESTVKWAGGIGIVLIAGYIALEVLTATLAIVACACVGLAALNGLPVLTRKLASWKYKMIRQDVIDNPMPELIRQYDGEIARYKTKREGVTQFSTVTMDFKGQIEAYKERGSDTTAMQAMYENMKRALEFQVSALREQKENLEEAKQLLANAQDQYNMALAMQKANAHLKDFTGQSAMDFSLQREAFAAITSKLNKGFAQMEISMALDYNALPNSVQEREVLDLNVITQQLKETRIA